MHAYATYTDAPMARGLRPRASAQHRAVRVREASFGSDGGGGDGAGGVDGVEFAGGGGVSAVRVASKVKGAAAAAPSCWGLERRRRPPAPLPATPHRCAIGTPCRTPAPARPARAPRRPCGARRFLPAGPAACCTAALPGGFRFKAKTKQSCLGFIAKYGDTVGMFDHDIDLYRMDRTSGIWLS